MMLLHMGPCEVSKPCLDLFQDAACNIVCCGFVGSVRQVNHTSKRINLLYLDRETQGESYYLIIHSSIVEHSFIDYLTYLIDNLIFQIGVCHKAGIG